MPTIAEIRSKAVDAAEKMKALQKGAAERKAAREAAATPEARDKLPTEWPEKELAEWNETCKRYDESKAELETAQRDEEMVARAAEVGNWLEQSTADPNRRPNLDDTVPGGGETRSYGELGLENRDQAKQIEHRQRDLTLAFQAWAGYGVPGFELREAHREACERVKLNPGNQGLELRLLDTADYNSIQRRLRDVHPTLRGRIFDELLESRAMSSGLGASGAYLTVPASVVRTIEIAMISFGAFLDEVETITTETGEEMSWPVADDTGNEAAYTDENPTTAPSDVEASYEKVVWRSHDLQSKFIKVPFKLFRDSFARIEIHIAQLIGERFGRKLAGEITNGVAKIRGIIPRSPVGNTAASATAIAYEDVIDLESSLDPAHQPGAKHMFHQNILGELRKIADSQNRPLWHSNLAAGAPDTFNGKGYALNQKMDSAVTTGLKTMAYGQLRQYKLRRVGASLRLRRLLERFAEFDQTAFIGYLSADGNLLRPNANAACPVQVLQQA